MTKVDGWVIHRRDTHRIFLMIWVGGLTIAPYFSSMLKLQLFGDMLQSAGIDMAVYESAFAKGLEDNNDLILDPDPFIIYPKIMSARN